MFVGLCRMDLHLPASRSLKAKRSLVQRVKGRIAQRFQVSVAEVGHHDLWQLARLGVAVVGTPQSHVRERLGKIRRLVEQEHGLFIVSWIEEIQKFEPDEDDLAVPRDPEKTHDDPLG
jgi:uncharacterized protein YlxP (DUF503 family)